MTGACLVHDRQSRAELVRKLLCLLCTTHIRRDDDRIFDLVPEVVGENRAGIQHVDGDLEESLNLIAVEVKRNEVVCTRFLQQTRHQFGGDRLPWFRNAVLACVGEVGEQNVHVRCEAQFCSLAHQEKFEECVMRIAAGGLEQKYLLSAHGFLKAHVAFTACEFLQGDAAKGATQALRQALAESAV